jgi:DNA polymerase-1
MGDSGDNIPGVKGVGPKGAAEVLFAHGSLDALLERDPETRPERLIHEQKQEALASRSLVQLWDDAPVMWDPARQMVGGFDVRAAREHLRGFGFTAMADDLPSFPKQPFYRAAG